jgi:CRP-like cAMP-binding protein
MAQGLVCNRVHSIAQRCARWLLTHDRVDVDQFPLTQEFLALMLGVHRAGVSVVAGKRQKAGLIRYSRGVITILDRVGLEAAACECYRIIEAEYRRLLG